MNAGTGEQHAQRKNSAELGEGERISQFKAATEFCGRFPEATRLLAKMVGSRETGDVLDIRVFVCARFPNRDYAELRQEVQNTNR